MQRMVTPYRGLLTVRNIFGITQPVGQPPQRLACVERRCAPRGWYGNIKDSRR